MRKYKVSEVIKLLEQTPGQTRQGDSKRAEERGA